GDQIWLLGGTYVVTNGLALKADLSLYGSFAGTESTTSQRAKVSGGKPWEFVNQSVIDGNNLNAKGLTTAISVNPTYIDGVKVTKFAVNAFSANGIGANLVTNNIMRNCIVSENTFTGTGITVCKAAGVCLTGPSQLLDSYIFHNSNLKGTSSANASCAGVIVYGNEFSIVKGCTIENNIATNSCGGIFFGDGGATLGFRAGGTLENCIIKGNVATGGAGGGIGSYSTAVTSPIIIKNCQVIENTSGANGGGAYFDLSGTTVTLEGCSFIGNVSNAAATTTGGGGAIMFQAGNFGNPAEAIPAVDRCIFRDNKLSADAEGAAIFCNKPITMQNCLIVNNSTATTNTDKNIVKFTADGCKILNSTIANNLTTGAGRSVSFLATATTSELTNCLFYGNVTESVSGTAIKTYNAYDHTLTTPETGSITSINSWNTFKSPTSFKGAPANDTQKSESAAANWKLGLGSPAIDAGTGLYTISFDLTGTKDRKIGSGFDMGAYEYDPIDGINNVKFDYVCYSKNNQIQLQGLTAGMKVSVYAISGQLVSTENAINSTISIPVLNGIYLVKVENQVRKVIVK
ncbi:MAG: choice-of-anchor Q domain-containing protein, partial [Paludibacter sp.]